MAHFAEVNSDNIVVAVHYVGNETILDENGEVCDHIGHHRCTENCCHDDHRMIQTSYNSNIRSRFAGVGDYYVEELDIFVRAKPFNSYILDTNTGEWIAPVEKPELLENYDCRWDEEKYESEGDGWIIYPILTELQQINGSFKQWDDTLGHEVLIESPLTQKMLDAGISAVYDESTKEWTIIEPTHLLSKTEEEFMANEGLVEPYRTELLEARRKYVAYLESNSKV